MKPYSALIKKNLSGQIEDIVLLKDGFSWSALFFSNLWFLYHKMWREFLVITCFTIVLSILFSSSSFDKFSLQFSLTFLVALNANYWLCEFLRKRKNYEFVGLIFADNLFTAKLRLIKNLENSSNSFDVFDDSLLDPKSFRKLCKIKKLSNHFSFR